jgi:hypothetical protein
MTQSPKQKQMSYTEARPPKEPVPPHHPQKSGLHFAAEDAKIVGVKYISASTLKAEDYVIPHSATIQAQDTKTYKTRLVFAFGELYLLGQRHPGGDG